VDCVVIDDGVDRLVDRHLGLNGIEEAYEPLGIPSGIQMSDAIH
jgi:hypothetical protein